MYKFRSDADKKEFIEVGKIYPDFVDSGLNVNQVIVDYLDKNGYDQFYLVYWGNDNYIINMDDDPTELEDLIYHFSQSDVNNFLVEVY